MMSWVEGEVLKQGSCEFFQPIFIIEPLLRDSMNSKEQNN